MGALLLIRRSAGADGRRTRHQPKPGELVRAGVVGAVVQIAKEWIRSGYARSVDAVAADALKICRVLAA